MLGKPVEPQTSWSFAPGINDYRQQFYVWSHCVLGAISVSDNTSVFCWIEVIVWLLSRSKWFSWRNGRTEIITNQTNLNQVWLTHETKISRSHSLIKVRGGGVFELQFTRFWFGSSTNCCQINTNWRNTRDQNEHKHSNLEKWYLTACGGGLVPESGSPSSRWRKGFCRTQSWNRHWLHWQRELHWHGRRCSGGWKRRS